MRTFCLEMYKSLYLDRTVSNMILLLRCIRLPCRAYDPLSEKALEFFANHFLLLEIGGAVHLQHRAEDERVVADSVERVLRIVGLATWLPLSRRVVSTNA